MKILYGIYPLQYLDVTDVCWGPCYNNFYEIWKK